MKFLCLKTFFSRRMYSITRSCSSKYKLKYMYLMCRKGIPDNCWSVRYLETNPWTYTNKLKLTLKHRAIGEFLIDLGGGGGGGCPPYLGNIFVEIEGYKFCAVSFQMEVSTIQRLTRFFASLSLLLNNLYL